MALDRFRAAPLPNPPAQYDSQYMRQFLRVIENYFSQLDSRTPNNAQKYTADEFIGGTVRLANVTTVEKNALTPAAGMLVFDTTLGKLCVYTGAAWQTVTSV
jgi:hypothetical protein